MVSGRCSRSGRGGRVGGARAGRRPCRSARRLGHSVGFSPWEAGRALTQQLPAGATQLLPARCKPRSGGRVNKVLSAEPSSMALGSALWDRVLREVPDTHATLSATTPRPRACCRPRCGWALPCRGVWRASAQFDVEPVLAAGFDAADGVTWQELAVQRHAGSVRAAHPQQRACAAELGWGAEIVPARGQLQLSPSPSAQPCRPHQL